MLPFEEDGRAYEASCSTASPELPIHPRGMRVGRTDPGSRLPGAPGAAFDSSAVATFEAGQNTVSTSTASTGADGGFTGGSACSQPPS